MQGTEPSRKWVALGYSVPMNPSRNRVYVWRKLKEFGTEYFRQGVAVLPYNSKNLARLGRLAQRINEIGGEGQLIEIRFISSSDEAAMIQKFRRQSDNEYAALLRECAGLFSQVKVHAGQRLSEYETGQMKKAVKKYTAVKSRDHFRCGGGGEFEEKLYSAIDSFRASASDLASQLSHALDKLGR